MILNNLKPLKYKTIKPTYFSQLYGFPEKNIHKSWLYKDPLKEWAQCVFLEPKEDVWDINLLWAVEYLRKSAASWHMQVLFSFPLTSTCAPSPAVSAWFTLGDRGHTSVSSLVSFQWL